MARYLLDTNVLLRILQPDSDQREAAIRAVSALVARGDIPFVTPQVIIEFWAVATRALEANGYGWSAKEASSQVDAILSRFPILEDSPAVFPNWLNLVRGTDAVSKQVHDARLVALMQAHGVSHILTFNVGVFARYQGIEVVHPERIP